MNGQPNPLEEANLEYINSELKAIYDEDNELKKIIKIGLLREKYPSLGTIEKIVELARNSKSKKEDVPFFYSGSEYFNEVEEIKPLLFPFLGSPSVGILYGASGTQKSSFSYFLAKCLAIPNYYTDEDKLSDLENHKVLICQLEESRLVTKQRFSDVKDKDFNNIKFLNSDLNWNIDNKNILNQLLDEHKPSLVIIDSLSKANRNSKSLSTETNYGNFIFEYQHTASKYHTCIMFIHHTLKNNEIIAGTQKILDNADFIFKWTSKNDCTKHLKVEKNRLIDDSLNNTYKFTLESNKWSYHGLDNNSNKTKEKKDNTNIIKEKVYKMSEIELRVYDIIQRASDKSTMTKSKIQAEYANKYPNEKLTHSKYTTARRNLTKAKKIREVIKTSGKQTYEVYESPTPPNDV